MSAIHRATSGVKSVVTDPVGRRAYLARLKWLMNGSGALQAWSLEYRAGLSGRYAVDANRAMPDDELVLRCPDDCGANAPLSHLYERRFVYRLHDTVASTASGASLLCGTPEPPFFVRESITWPFESILSHGLEIPELKQAQPRPGTSVVFPTTGNYYHWLIEDLPLVLRARDVAPDATYLAFEDGITSKHRDVATLLGLALRPAPLVVRMQDQVLPGRSSDSWFVHPADARRLSELGRRITEASDPATERIYVSRRFSARALPDEERLEKLLQQQGFSVLHLESMPWRDQIATFQRASVVVAPHGAGLANLVFTPPGATVVELTNGYQYNRCFEWICHVVGHTYRALDSDASPSSADPERLARQVQAQLG